MLEAPADGRQELYLATLSITTSEHIKFNNRAIFGLSENDKSDITRSMLIFLPRIGRCCIHVCIQNISSDCHIPRWSPCT